MKFNCIMCNTAFKKKRKNTLPYFCKKCAKQYSIKKNLIKNIDKIYEKFTKIHIHEKKMKKTDDISFVTELKKLHNLHILELGCGTEFTSRHLSKDNKITVTDISKEDVKITKKNVKNVNAISCDAMKLPFHDNSFDFVYSNQLIEHLPLVKKHFKEVRRILKKRGKYLFETPNAWLANPYYKFIGAYDIKIFHPSTLSPIQTKRILKKIGFNVKFIPIKQISKSVEMKLPKNKLIRKYVKLILENIPFFFQPNILCLAIKK